MQSACLAADLTAEPGLDPGSPVVQGPKPRAVMELEHSLAACSWPGQSESGLEPLPIHERLRDGLMLPVSLPDAAYVFSSPEPGPARLPTGFVVAQLAPAGLGALVGRLGSAAAEPLLRFAPRLACAGWKPGKRRRRRSQVRTRKQLR